MGMSGDSGSVELKAFGMSWRILYLPIAMPFSGSVRGSNPSTMWPDPFALTRTEYATTPKTWRDKRELDRERRRIEKSMKERAKLKRDRTGRENGPRPLSTVNRPPH
jgi:hypothetical protein